MDRRMIFSRPMVRALLAGAKTQTRRRVTWRPGAFARGYTEPVTRTQIAEKIGSEG